MTNATATLDLAFVPEWADQAQRFFEGALVHTKGRWARVPFTLEPWQRDDIIRPLFGVARYDEQWDTWVRLYNEAWLELGRGNGKSELLAGIALKLLVADGEEGAEIYGAAVDREQAGLVFHVAKRMVDLSPALSRMVDGGSLRVIESRKTIVHLPTDSFYRVIAADAAGNLGQAPHGVIFDEIIAQPSRDLYDALRTGLGKRDQPLMICATTAGNQPDSFAAVEHREALRVAKDWTRQPNRLVYARNVPEQLTPAEAEELGLPLVPLAEGQDPDGPRNVDVFNETTWHYANPALGSFLSLATLRSEARAAQSEPTKEAAFRQFRANQWVAQATRALSIQKWDALGGLVVPDQLAGRLAPYGGLDLAAVNDLAALAWVFPPYEDADGEELSIPVLWRFWCTPQVIERIDAHTGGQFRQWIKEGRVHVSDGNQIDLDDIHDQITADASRFGCAMLALDPWNSAGTINWAEKVSGIPWEKVGQTMANLSPPTKELIRLVGGRELNTGGDPVARWMANELELLRDRAENLRPVKPDRLASGSRVDGMVALIMALRAWMLDRDQHGPSVYETNDLTVV